MTTSAAIPLSAQATTHQVDKQQCPALIEVEDAIFRDPQWVTPLIEDGYTPITSTLLAQNNLQPLFKLEAQSWSRENVDDYGLGSSDTIFVNVILKDLKGLPISTGMTSSYISSNRAVEKAIQRMGSCKKNIKRLISAI